MRQALKFLGLMTGVGPLMTALRSSWEAFDAYGRVAAGEAAVLRLPAGPVSIAFESSNRGSHGASADVPSITGPDGRPLPVEYMGRLQGPSATKSGMFADERMRKRFASVDLPTEGEYTVRATGCTVMLGSAGFSRRPRPVAARPIAA